MWKVYFLMLCLFLVSNDVDGQRFKAAAVAGLNFAQIDGDDLYGYSKLGLSGGLKISYPIQKKLDLSLEMLYSERGSTNGFGFGDKTTNYTSLRYLEVPVLIRLKDWYIDDHDYHKASVHGGLSAGYLFDVSSSNGQFSNNLDNFKQLDLSYVLGINYRFSRLIGLTVRYTRSLTDLVSSGAISHFITVRTEYNF